MQLTAELLAELSLSATSIVSPFVQPLNDLMPQWGVDTILRRAHFLAQTCEESAGFRRLSENLTYTHVDVIGGVWPKLAKRASLLVRNPEALGNAAYANEGGNGDEASGDGYRYRGRGLIQVTFKNGYLRIGAEIGLDLVGNPDLLLEPANAVKSALAYWKLNDCNTPADADNVANVTRKINPRLEGLEARSAFKQRAIALGI